MNNTKIKHADIFWATVNYNRISVHEKTIFREGFETFMILVLKEECTAFLGGETGVR